MLAPVLRALAVAAACYAIWLFTGKPDGVAGTTAWLKVHGVQAFGAIAASIVLWVAAGIRDGSALEPGPGAALRDNRYATGHNHAVDDDEG